MFKCTQKKAAFKNLTVDKDYEGKIEGDMVVVICDNGSTQRYHKKYFSELKTPASKKPAPRPEPVRLTIAQVIAQFISFRKVRDQQAYTITYSGPERAENRLTLVGSPISCGVWDMSGIAGMEDMADSIINDHGHLNVSDVATALWNAFFNHLRTAETGIPYIICSTNVAENTVEYWNPLNALAVSTVEGVNPSSGNTIRIWIIRVN